MSSQIGTTEILAKEIGRVLAPLAERLSRRGVRDLFAELGMRFPPELLDNGAFAGALDAGAAAARAIPPIADQLTKAVRANDTARALAKGAELVKQIGTAIAALDRVEATLRAAGPLPGLTAGDLNGFAANLASRLLDHALITYLEDAYPGLANGLALIGLVERTQKAGDPGNPARPPYVERKLHLERVGPLVQSPETYAETRFGWGAPGFDGRLLFKHLHRYLEDSSLPAVVEPATTSAPLTLTSVVFTLKPERKTSPPGVDLTLNVPVEGGFDLAIPLGGQTWTLHLVTTGRFVSGARATITPPADVTLVPPRGSRVEGELRGEIVGRPVGSSDALVVLGLAGGSRLEARSVTVSLAFRAAWDAASNRATGAPAFLARVSGGKLVIAPPTDDGFLSTVIPPDGFQIGFDFGLEWTSDRGLRLTGGAGLETTIGVHKRLGPLSIDSLHLSLSFDGSKLALVLDATAGVELGPVMATIDRMGLKGDLDLARRGNLGPVDLAVAFKPPTGLGILVDAGPVSGGGFLSFDHENGRYAGVLQLQILSVSVKAIGLIETRLPGGAKGFSFLIIITAEFPPIQLGFGFTLNGVGGLAGIHRTVVTEALQAGIRTGAARHILFPQDPVKNAARIISDLRTIFPPAPDRYVFGPMAIIGWGTPTLVEARVGIILELGQPVRLVLLGELSACLPDRDNVLVELHVSVLGIVDFGRKFLSIDASLYDSRILAFAIHGDMALRLSWGSPPSFVLSIGGLNPRFQPPPGFPKLRRLTIALGTGKSPRLSLQSYMAVTSNTVQFGARAELYVDVGVFGLNVYGSIRFDALINFSPFSFVVDFGATIAVRTGTTPILAIRLEATLGGPAPWHVRGEATFTFLLIPVRVHFDARFGEERPPGSLPRRDPWLPLQEAIEDARNWSAGTPPSGRQVVSVAEPRTDKLPVLVDPMGQVTMRQKVLPLNRKITRFAQARPAGPGRYDVDRVQIGGRDEQGWDTVRDYFSPAQFTEMSDAEKLSRPSFEKMDAGITVGSNAIGYGKSRTVSKGIVYETTIVDSPRETRKPAAAKDRLYALPLGHQRAMTGLGAAARSPLRSTGNERFMPPPATPAQIALDDEQFAVVSTDDLGVLIKTATRSEAHQALADHLAGRPEQRGRLQVVPLHELEVPQ